MPYQIGSGAPWTTTPLWLPCCECFGSDGWAATMPDADARAPFMRRVARAWPEKADRQMRARDIAGKYGDLNLKHAFLKEIIAAGAAARNGRGPRDNDRPVVDVAQEYEDIVRAVSKNLEDAQKDDNDPKKFSREPTLFKNTRGVVRMIEGRIEELRDKRPPWRELKAACCLKPGRVGAYPPGKSC